MNGKVFDVLYKRDEHQGKGVWIKCGVMLQKPDGKMAIKLDVVPVGQWSGWLQIGERKQNFTDAVM